MLLTFPNILCMLSVFSSMFFSNLRSMLPKNSYIFSGFKNFNIYFYWNSPNAVCWNTLLLLSTLSSLLLKL